MSPPTAPAADGGHDPVLHLLAGPNGSGKTTFFEQVLDPVLALPFVNADRIATQRWPGDEVAHGLDAALAAGAERDRMIDRRRSFVTETVFSHPSKLDLVARARTAGYLTTLHVMLVPEDLAVARVGHRVHVGGHHVPEDKIRSRYRRTYSNIAQALTIAETTHVYDNTTARQAFRPVAAYQHGILLDDPDWPEWTPDVLRLAGGRR